MAEIKVVTKEQYAKVLDQHKDEVYQLALKGWQIPILHGLIALAADHPGVKKLGWPTQQLINQVRWWFREKFSEWGFNRGEVEYLDKMREAVEETPKENPYPETIIDEDSGIEVPNEKHKVWAEGYRAGHG